MAFKGIGWKIQIGTKRSEMKHRYCQHRTYDVNFQQVMSKNQKISRMRLKIGVFLCDRQSHSLYTEILVEIE